LIDTYDLRELLCAAMSVAFSSVGEALKWGVASRQFEGALKASSLVRLLPSLANETGNIQYKLVFGVDLAGTPTIDLQAVGTLSLRCERTREIFPWSVQLETKLGVIGQEEDEAKLFPGFEPLLVAGSPVALADIVEDELILLLPAIPFKPGSESEQEVFELGDSKLASPFAVLKSLQLKS
jgi:uncharacterized protein